MIKLFQRRTFSDPVRANKPCIGGDIDENRSSYTVDEMHQKYILHGVCNIAEYMFNLVLYQLVAGRALGEARPPHIHQRIRVDQ